MSKKLYQTYVIVILMNYFEEFEKYELLCIFFFFLIEIH